MTRRIRPTVLLTVLALGSGVFLMARPAQAQRNTYADFPYNQGSLFYRYLGPGSKPKKVHRPATRPAPAPPQAGYTYTYPQPNAYAPQPQYYYNPQTRSYFYYPASPVPTQPAPAPVVPRAAAAPKAAVQPVPPR